MFTFFSGMFEGAKFGKKMQMLGEMTNFLWRFSKTVHPGGS